MSVPTPPYCTSATVASFLSNLAPMGDFSDVTAPPKATVDMLIETYSAWIDTRFATAGYYIPWQAMEGEGWPDHQTLVLQLHVAFGVAGAISGPVLKPAPAIGTRRGVADNVYTADYKAFLDGILEHGHSFRAKCHVGTKAEKFTRDPIGPLTDYLLGYFDATRWQTIGEFTSVVESVRNAYGADSLVFDALRTLRESMIGV